MEFEHQKSFMKLLVLMLLLPVLLLWLWFGFVKVWFTVKVWLFFLGIIVGSFCFELRIKLIEILWRCKVTIEIAFRFFFSLVCRLTWTSMIITLALLLLINNLVAGDVVNLLHWFITKNLVCIVNLFEFLCCRFFVLSHLVGVIFLSKFIKSFFNF